MKLVKGTNRITVSATNKYGKAVVKEAVVTY